MRIGELWCRLLEARKRILKEDIEEKKLNTGTVKWKTKSNASKLQRCNGGSSDERRKILGMKAAVGIKATGDFGLHIFALHLDNHYSASGLLLF
ncbi:hypothetical protein SDJN03_14405, partial [Cucurbita argyrosperma subsp. sororia]